MTTRFAMVEKINGSRTKRNNIMRITGALFIIGKLLVLAALLTSQPAWAIKKCQDENGKWHYGDVAVAACQKSGVTTLTDRGFIAKDAERPKTEAELAIEAEEKAKALEQAKIERAAEEERIRILSVYETEEDIDRQRENQLNSVETNIAVHETYINQLGLQNEHLKKQMASQKGRLLELSQGKFDSNQEKIEGSKQALLQLAERKKEVDARFDREKELFRTFKADAEG